AGFIVSNMQMTIHTSMFQCTFQDISECPQDLACGLTELSKKFAKLEPHPLHAKAGDYMVYAVPLIIFMHDVSGNVSKQWNIHHVVYMLNVSLPCDMLEKEFCFRFVTASPHAAPM
ncbi:hypothetical protein PAXRUDRAFT_175419, partial [Paxillus rubicundulus Ve08.2h10]